MISRINQLITHLNLLPHPEGGYFAETYRSKEVIEQRNLPNRFKGDRNFSTAIYFLLPAGEFSAFHRIESDEVWHFYEGSPLLVYVINLQGEMHVIHLGCHIEKGEVFQAVVPAGSWFASKPATTDGYSLVGCTVAPGFDFAGFEMAERESLIHSYPEHALIIKELTRINSL